MFDVVSAPAAIALSIGLTTGMSDLNGYARNYIITSGGASYSEWAARIYDTGIAAGCQIILEGCQSRSIHTGE